MFFFFISLFRHSHLFFQFIVLKFVYNCFHNAEFCLLFCKPISGQDILIPHSSFLTSHLSPLTSHLCFKDHAPDKQFRIPFEQSP